MAMAVGATETERAQIVAALRNGKTYSEATASFRAGIEREWFDRNETHLLEISGRAAKPTHSKK